MIVNGKMYLVDGFCKATNTVYEVNEKYHKTIKYQDEKRYQVINETFGCNVIIIEDPTH